MRPYLFQIGEVTIASYTLAWVVGIVFGTLLCIIAAGREGLDLYASFEGYLVLVVTGLTGARLLHVVQNWDFYRHYWTSIFEFRFTGFAFLGFFWFALLAGYSWSRARGYPFLLGADIVSTYLLPVVYFFVRIGCTLAGCCYGKTCDLPWAIVIPWTGNVPRHPVTLYGALGIALIFILLVKMYPYRPFNGFNLILVAGLYGILRFITDFFRQETLLWKGLTFTQLICSGMIVISIVFLGFKLRDKLFTGNQ